MSAKEYVLYLFPCISQLHFEPKVWRVPTDRLVSVPENRARTVCKILWHTVQWAKQYDINSKSFSTAFLGDLAVLPLNRGRARSVATIVLLSAGFGNAVKELGIFLRQRVSLWNVSRWTLSSSLRALSSHWGRPLAWPQSSPCIRPSDISFVYLMCRPP